jgi:thiol-disulfide isomerase/thioredoxin
MKKIVNLLLVLLFSSLVVHSGLAYSGELSSAKPWMGVAIEEVKNGVLIQQTLEGTPAEKAGLKAGDVITKLNGVKMNSVRQLIDYVGNLGVGNKVEVKFIRKYENKTLTLKLVPRPDALALLNENFLDKKAPDFNVKNLKTGKFTSFPPKSSVEKVRVVEFWATWCPACLHSFGVISKKYSDLEKAGVEFVSVSDEDEKTLKNHFKDGFPPFEVYRDSKGEGVKKYMVSALPTLFVVDKKGIVRYVAIGAGDYLEEALSKAIELSK